MKLTIEVETANGYDDRDEAYRALHADDAWRVLWDIREALRGDYTDDEALGYIRDIMRDNENMFDYYS